jgi:ketol-acid reductoisomerase
MNRVISDTAEYGCYLFSHAAVPLLADFMKNIDTSVIGKTYNEGGSDSVNNKLIVEVNAALRYTLCEQVGEELRGHMTAMKEIVG